MSSNTKFPSVRKIEDDEKPVGRFAFSVRFDSPDDKPGYYTYIDVDSDFAILCINNPGLLDRTFETIRSAMTAAAAEKQEIAESKGVAKETTQG